jgi:hypothetical protein
MRVYYDPSSSLDADMKELIELRRMDMLKDGASSQLVESNSLVSKKSNAFQAIDRFDSDYGKRLLKKQGWQEGESIGLPTRHGLKEALDGSDGKHPLDKRGIGYHGEKVDIQQRIEQQKLRRERERRNAPYYIASKYDRDPESQDTLFRRFDPKMKYTKTDQKMINL